MINDDIAIVLAVIWGIGVVFGIIQAIVFYFTTIRRLEKQFRQEAIERLDWDGVGLRIPGYAMILCLSPKRINDNNYSLLPVSATRRLATRTDRLMAKVLYINFFICLILLFVITVFTDFVESYS